MSSQHESPSVRYLPVDEFIEKNRRDGRPIIGRTATYEALRCGELPHIRIGRRILIPEDAFDRVLAAQTGASSLNHMSSPGPSGR